MVVLDIQYCKSVYEREIYVIDIKIRLRSAVGFGLDNVAEHVVHVTFVIFSHILPGTRGKSD